MSSLDPRQERIAAKIAASQERLDGRITPRPALPTKDAHPPEDYHTLIAEYPWLAVGLGLKAPVSLRVNPNVDPKTHPYISTGLKGNKFGIAHEEALRAYRHAASLPGLKVVGIDCHIGSQITEVTPYLDAMDRVLDLVAEIEAAGIPIHHIDFGGGLGIDYNGDTPPAADDLWRQLLAKLDTRGYGQRQLMIEPGRSLVGNAGVCLTEVQYLKPGESKNFCIVDAAMNDLPRPAMYQAFHAIVPVQERAGTDSVAYDVVGPVCESGDWLGRDRDLAQRGRLGGRRQRLDRGGGTVARSVFPDYPQNSVLAAGRALPNRRRPRPQPAPARG